MLSTSKSQKALSAFNEAKKIGGRNFKRGGVETRYYYEIKLNKIIEEI